MTHSQGSYPILTTLIKRIDKSFFVWVLILFAALRLSYFNDISHSPLMSAHKNDQTDMYFFDQWASKIAFENDIYSTRIGHPFANWHAQIAKQYLAENANLQQENHSTIDDVTLQKQVWDHWYGKYQFHQEPLYPYLIAFLYKITGTADTRIVYIFQGAFSLLSLLLVYSISKSLFGVKVAKTSALFYCLSSVNLYYEAILVRSTLIVFFTLLLTYLSLKKPKSKTVVFLFGATSGLAILLKSTFALFLILYFILEVGLYFKAILSKTLPSPSRQLSKICFQLTVFFLGIGLTLLPLMIRNHSLDLPLLSLSSVGPITFINANLPDFPPEVGFYSSPLSAKIMNLSDGQFIPAIVQTLRQFNSPMQYALLLTKKLHTLIHWYEIPNNTNFYYYQIHAPILRFLPRFSFFLLFGLLGVILLIFKKHNLSKTSPILLMALSQIFVLLGFYVISRFRVALIPLMIPFSAYFITQLYPIAFIKTLNLKTKKAFLFLAPALMTAFIFSPLSTKISVIRPTDYIAPYTTYYIPLFTQYSQNAHWQEALDLAQKSLNFAPPQLTSWASGTVKTVKNPNDLTLAQFYSDVYRFLAQCDQNLQLLDQRESDLQKAINLLQIQLEAN